MNLIGRNQQERKEHWEQWLNKRRCRIIQLLSKDLIKSSIWIAQIIKCLV